MIVFHVAEPGAYDPSAPVYTHESLQTEGFIHCSTEEQLPRTLERFFPGRTDVTILSIDTDRLDAELRWEGADGDLFPHVYGAIGREAIVAKRRLA